MKKFIASIAVLAPSIAFAAQPITDANSLVAKLNSIGNTVIAVLISFAVIYIIVNVVQFIMADGESRDEKRKNILWGIVGLAIILSIWGLVNVVLRTFVFNDNNAPTRGVTGGTLPARNGIAELTTEAGQKALLQRMQSQVERKCTPAALRAD